MNKPLASLSFNRMDHTVLMTQRMWNQKEGCLMLREYFVIGLQTQTYQAQSGKDVFPEPHREAKVQA